MKRLSPVALALFLAGCGADMGVGGTIALDTAERIAPSELVAAVHALPPDADREIIVDGRLWLPWGRPVELGAAGLRPVASAHGTTVYARGWDRSPYDALLTRHDGGWQGYAPVIGRSGGPSH